MPEYWVERGIGETRHVMVDKGEIVEARIEIDGNVPAGSILQARLIRTGRHAIARANGVEYLLNGGASGKTEGAMTSIIVTREAIGTEPWKRPLARLASDLAVEPSTETVQELLFPAPHDRLAEAGWEDLVDEARSGLIAFPGGGLRISVTPAMTLIDVDGTLPVSELAMAGAIASARTIRRHGIAGSIGIDLPTVPGKAARVAIDEAIDAELVKPFERTATNGFGFVQIIRPRRHASLFELALDRSPFEARALLRRASRMSGAVTLSANPAVVAAIRPDWVAALERQIGGTVTLRADPSLAKASGHAQ
ncbi:MAG: ribonuclease [Sphingomicrobium sp.]